MQELIERLRSYLPLGLECHWSQASKNYVIAFDLIESQAAEIENLQSLWTIAHNERSEAMLELAKARRVCDQMGKALEWYCRQNEDPDSQEILKAWRSMK